MLEMWRSLQIICDFFFAWQVICMGGVRKIAAYIIGAEGNHPHRVTTTIVEGLCLRFEVAEILEGGHQPCPYVIDHMMEASVTTRE